MRDPLDDAAPTTLIAWELGGGLGHASKGLLLASQLAAAGCEVSFAVRDLAATHPLIPDASHRLFQAPVAHARLQGATEPASYGEMLLHAGLGHPASLKGLIRGWLTLFEADATGLVIADHAPSAVLAARCAGLPVLLFGHGFFVPPPTWPVFRDWEAAPADRIDRSHAHLLASINACLVEFGAAPLPLLSALFDGADNYLCTWPELDHYPRAAGAHDHHVGTVCIDRVGAPPLWPGASQAAGERGGVPRVFAYLRPTLPGLSDVLAALVASGAAVLVASPGLAPDVVRRWSSERLAFAPQLVRLDGVARDADLVVCSGSDTLHGMALAGVPVLGLPMNAEQRIAASRVAELGVGRWLLPGTGAAALQSAVADLLADPSYRANAEALRLRHPARPIEDQLASVVAACQRMLQRRAAPTPP